MEENRYEPMRPLKENNEAVGVVWKACHSVHIYLLLLPIKWRNSRKR